MSISNEVTHFKIFSKEDLECLLFTLPGTDQVQEGHLFKILWHKNIRQPNLVQFPAHLRCEHPLCRRPDMDKFR